MWSIYRETIFTCPACDTVEEMQGLRKETASINDLAKIQRQGFEKLSKPYLMDY